MLLVLFSFFYSFKNISHYKVENNFFYRNICTYNKNTSDKSKDDPTATPMHIVDSDDTDDHDDGPRNEHDLDTDTADEDIPLSVLLNKQRVRSG